MAKPLPQNKLLEGIFEPWTAESNINDLIVIGEIPRELNGIFFRNGQNPQYVFDTIIHYDLGNNTKQVHDFGLGNNPAEPIFVPRNPNSPEGNGFLLKKCVPGKKIEAI